MSIQFTTEKSNIRTLKPGDKHFQIQGKFMLTDRAGIDISQKCPPHYAQVILECYNRGWIKAVANVTERELIFMGLSDGQAD